LSRARQASRINSRGSPQQVATRVATDPITADFSAP
jgi:hypothetical protein